MSDHPDVVRGDDLRREPGLPFGEGDDHANGIALIGPPQDRRLPVVYDSPAGRRLTPDGAVLADLVRLSCVRAAGRTG